MSTEFFRIVSLIKLKDIVQAGKRRGSTISEKCPQRVFLAVAACIVPFIACFGPTWLASSANVLSASRIAPRKVPGGMGRARQAVRPSGAMIVC